MDAEPPSTAWESIGGEEPRPVSTGAWWHVRPMELAARYDFDPDKLTDSIYPEGLADWQLDICFEAMEICLDNPSMRHI
jgi:hypothetical protein